MRPDRHVIAIGRTKGQDRTLAVKCSWCNRWMSQEDERAAQLGAQTSHGMCNECAKTWDDSGWDPDGEAA